MSKSLLIGLVAIGMSGAAFAADPPTRPKECCCDKMKEQGKACCPEKGKEGHEGHSGHEGHTGHEPAAPKS